MQEQKHTEESAIARLEAFGVEAELKRAPAAPSHQVESQGAEDEGILESYVAVPRLESSVDEPFELIGKPRHDMHARDLPLHSILHVVYS